MKRVLLAAAISLVALSAKADNIATYQPNYQTGVPAISSCGTTPSLSGTSNDVQGQLTVGSGTITTCTVTFAVPRAKATACQLTPASSGSVGVGYISTAPSTTAFTITGTSLTSLVYNYHCPLA